jgi:hypothetical protein
VHLVQNDNSLEGVQARDRTFQAWSSTISLGPANISGNDAARLNAEWSKSEELFASN